MLRDNFHSLICWPVGVNKKVDVAVERKRSPTDRDPFRVLFFQKRASHRLVHPQNSIERVCMDFSSYRSLGSRVRQLLCITASACVIIVSLPDGPIEIHCPTREHSRGIPRRKGCCCNGRRVIHFNEGTEPILWCHNGGQLQPRVSES